jgi:hypothetical protein
MAHPRKSSACVTLVLIGAAALAGCSDSSTTGRRAAYATREACLADWNDARDCDEQQGTDKDGQNYRYWGHYGGGGGGHGSGYGGPRGGSTGHSISHGGFGSHGSSSS